MSILNRRLCCLETAGSSECPEFDLWPNEVVEGYEIHWHDYEDDGPPQPEFIGACGQQTAFVVGWTDLEPIGPGEEYS